jgi:hypothetical protein
VLSVRICDPAKCRIGPPGPETTAKLSALMQWLGLVYGAKLGIRSITDVKPVFFAQSAEKFSDPIQRFMLSGPSSHHRWCCGLSATACRRKFDRRLDTSQTHYVKSALAGAQMFALRRVRRSIGEGGRARLLADSRKAVHHRTPCPPE